MTERKTEPELWVFDTVVGLQTLGDVRQTLAKVWSAHPEVPESVRAEIAIATGEIAANIVEHASRGRTTELRMEVVVLEDEVQVRFIDNGHRLDVDLDAVQMPDAMAERGRGLAVARAVLRNLSYQRTDDGNLWTLLSERFSR